MCIHFPWYNCLDNSDCPGNENHMQIPLKQELNLQGAKYLDSMLLPALSSLVLIKKDLVKDTVNECQYSTTWSVSSVLTKTLVSCTQLEVCVSSCLSVRVCLCLAYEWWVLFTQGDFWGVIHFSNHCLLLLAPVHHLGYTQAIMGCYLTLKYTSSYTADRLHVRLYIYRVFGPELVLILYNLLIY